MEEMRRRNDPLTGHYERQTEMVKTRKEQLGDMYVGYAAAVSVRSAGYSAPLSALHAPRREEHAHEVLRSAHSAALRSRGLLLTREHGSTMVNRDRPVALEWHERLLDV